MFTSGELERVSMALDAPMRQMEMRIMSDIVRRIKESGELTSTADWQINRLVQNGVSMEEVRTAVSDALGCSDAEVTEIFTAAVRKGYVRDRRLYEQSGNVFVPFEENAELQQLLGAVTVQTNTTLRNITQSLGFARRGADGHIHFIPLAGYYQQTLDSAVLDIASGAFDYDTVLKRAVREMTDSGLRTVDYATGWSNRVDVAARRAIMTGMNQLTAQMNEANAEKLGTDWFEVSWHSGARPSHWWGGRWFTRKQLETVCGLGDVTGLCGANCYHGYSPVIPGISVPTYSDEELAEMNHRENEPVEWNGRKYTRYEALQRQRRLETTMRAQRQEMQLLKEGGASEDDLINCRARYRTTSDEYARFSQAAGLPQQRERVTADGLGNIMQGRYKGGSGKPSPVKVPPVGAEVNDRVTSAERTELLSRNPVDIAENTSTSTIGFFEDETDIRRRFNAFTGRHYKNVIDDFVNQLPDVTNKDVLKVLKRANRGAMYSKSNRRNSYFNKDRNTVYLDKNATPSTIAHELFHKIDYDNNIASPIKPCQKMPLKIKFIKDDDEGILPYCEEEDAEKFYFQQILTARFSWGSNISLSGALDECISNDYKNLMKSAENSGQSLEDMLYLKYPEAFERKGRIKIEYRGISDIISGMTGDEINLGFHHNSDYWEKPFKLQKETFAQYGRIYFDGEPNVLKMLKELFPDTTLQIDSKIFEISQFGR